METILNDIPTQPARMQNVTIREATRRILDDAGLDDWSIEGYDYHITFSCDVWRGSIAYGLEEMATMLHLTITIDDDAKQVWFQHK